MDTGNILGSGSDFQSSEKKGILMRWMNLGFECFKLRNLCIFDLQHSSPVFIEYWSVVKPDPFQTQYTKQATPFPSPLKERCKAVLDPSSMRG